MCNYNVSKVRVGEHVTVKTLTNSTIKKFYTVQSSYDFQNTMVGWESNCYSNNDNKVDFTSTATLSFIILFLIVIELNILSRIYEAVVHSKDDEKQGEFVVVVVLAVALQIIAVFAFYVFSSIWC